MAQRTVITATCDKCGRSNDNRNGNRGTTVEIAQYEIRRVGTKKKRLVDLCARDAKVMEELLEVGAPIPSPLG